MESTEKVRARQELEDTLRKFSDIEYYEYEEVEEGNLVHKISPADLFRILRRTEQISIVHGKFLLYLDDRIIQLVGAQKEKEEFVKILSEDFYKHLEKVAREEVIKTTTEEIKAQWRQEGKEEAEKAFGLSAAIFERRMKIIGAVFAGLTVVTATITWLLGIWGR